MMFRKKTKVVSYKNERKLKRGIEKMARKGWEADSITAHKRGRNIFQAHGDQMASALFGTGLAGLFSKKPDSFVVVYKRRES